MKRLAGLRAWIGANVVPLVLIPLSLVLLWVALWRVWLPPLSTSGAGARTVTTVDANAPALPTHKVTTVVRTSHAAPPPRRSEALALVLLFLGVGSAMVAVFHDRIGSIEINKGGLKLELTPAEQTGAASLAGRLAGDGAGAATYGVAFNRYLRVVAAQRSSKPRAARRARGAVESALPSAAGLSADQASTLAERIADELLTVR